jgi:hypothetical protein
MRAASGIALLAFVLWPATVAADPPPSTLSLAQVGAIIASLGGASGLVALGCTQVAGRPGIRCEEVAGGVALGLLVISLPIIIVSVNQPSASGWMSHVDQVTITAAPGRGTVGWTARF